MMKNLYYRFKTSLVFNYPYCPVADTYLAQCIATGIKSIKSESDFRSTVTFHNGISYTFWNVNRYYAWLHDGWFKGENVYYRYDNARPKAETMYRFHEALANISIQE